jgi:hypothetical protein
VAGEQSHPQPQPQPQPARPAETHQPGQFYEGVGAARQQRTDALRTIDTVIRSTAVSGSVVLSPLTNAKVAQALTSLRRVNREKFAEKRLQHFMSTPDVIELFAQLVAMKFNEGMIKHSSRYQGEAVLPRERNDIMETCALINAELVFDERAQFFRYATSEESERMAKEAFRKRRMTKANMAK